LLYGSNTTKYKTFSESSLHQKINIPIQYSFLQVNNINNKTMPVNDCDILNSKLKVADRS